MIPSKDRIEEVAEGRGFFTSSEDRALAIVLDKLFTAGLGVSTDRLTEVAKSTSSSFSGTENRAMAKWLVLVQELLG